MDGHVTFEIPLLAAWIMELRDGAEVGETLTLLNSVDGHVTFEIPLLAAWIMEPAIVLRCQALRR